MTVSAIVATEVDGSSRGALTELADDDLGEGDVTVRVKYSSLNYKDGLAVTGKGRIVRRFPMVCGVDMAGVVEESASDAWQPGDEVLVTGWGLSESHPGGFTERQRVRVEWVVLRPDGLSLLQCMAVGTAGLTSMLCVMALEYEGLTPTVEGPVLVTGAAGGVGSIAVALLARLGYSVAASTGRSETHGFLGSLGATEFVDRSELAARQVARSSPNDGPRPSTWSAARRWPRFSDRRSTAGSVAACGLVGSSDLPTTVLPFILRGVRLIGVESVSCPTEVRRPAWDRLARDLPLDLLDSLTTVEPLARVPELASDIVAGRVRGRVVIDVNG